MKKNIKRILTALLFGLLFVSMPLAFSACKEKSDMPKLNNTYNNVTYRRFRPATEGYYAQFYPDEIKEYGDWYYTAGNIAEYDETGEPNTAQFIAAEVDGVPVLGLGYVLFMNSVGESHGSSTLKKLHIPSTIISLNQSYFNRCDGSLGDDISWFYCGRPKDLSVYNSYEKENIYVPNEKYSDFVELLPENALENIPFYKANVSYRLNMQELPKYYQTEYYYVDYVEYGKEIENIPPEPKMFEYKFGGWYTESDCINQWNFADTVPQPAEGEDFNELCLYAKWIKK